MFLRNKVLFTTADKNKWDAEIAAWVNVIVIMSLTNSLFYKSMLLHCQNLERKPEINIKQM